MKNRRTSDTRIALDRLAATAGWRVTRDGKKFCVHTPKVGDPPVPKKSASALAFLFEGLRGESADELARLRGETRYYATQGRDGQRNVPTQGLACWEIDALICLSLTEEEL